MIIQEIFYDCEKFLTIVHNGMDNDIKKRVIQKSIDVSRHEILLKERYIEKYQLENDNYEFFIKGFLDCENEKNPYTNYSTYFKQYVYPNKNDEIDNLSFKDFKKVYDFIYEYTNFKFTKLNINNIFLFFPTDILVKSIKSETTSYLIIKSSENISNISVKFKLNDIIKESINLTEIPNDNKIKSRENWNNYEIEIFDKDKIIYKSHTYVIMSINFNMGITTKIKKIKLNKFDKMVNSSNLKTEKFTISEENGLINISNYLLEESKNRNELNDVTKTECIFLRKNEREKAYEILEKLVKNDGELFIFDPYFLKQSEGKDVLKDLLNTILTHNDLVNIIFSKDIGESFENFKNSLTVDEKLFFKNIGGSAKKLFF
ncbi:hypothetical protein mru_1161 [Methanobrevibacter ruminantium M1]|uniref:Uncharacterized protein n=1 Tax=Methanobrevibacter ruminantium (strain ATCC 35063 / DSM 1093 / JCM 13430 / OCM 146 / M1) TaxID=634498 RepID=D3E3A0_METRM|nr:hypothetical protein [Methanobrevibacter ruminantium]ADC47011.1 hypothetical protein mru_1161 [Methanobrevibacter ruminantium M1]